MYSLIAWAVASGPQHTDNITRTVKSNIQFVVMSLTMVGALSRHLYCSGYFSHTDIHIMSVCEEYWLLSKYIPLRVRFTSILIQSNIVVICCTMNKMHTLFITVKTFPSKPVMAGVDPPTCYTCDVVRRKKDSPAEVWYDKVQHWACLECHLTEKALQKVKGKGTVREIQHKCSSCSCERAENKPCCFCYDCSQYFCKTCSVAGACVRISYR